MKKIAGFFLFLIALNLQGMLPDKDGHKESSESARLVLPLGDSDELDMSMPAPIAQVSFAELREERAKQKCALIVAGVKTTLADQRVVKHYYELSWLHGWLFGANTIIPSLLDGSNKYGYNLQYKQINPVNGRPIRVGNIDYFLLQPGATKFVYLCNDKQLCMGTYPYGDYQRRGFQLRNQVLTDYGSTPEQRSKAKTLLFNSIAEDWWNKYCGANCDFAYLKDSDADADQKIAEKKLSFARSAQDWYARCVAVFADADHADKEVIRTYSGACAQLGIIFSEGLGCDKNYDTALAYLERAIGQVENQEARGKALRVRGELYYKGLVDSPHADQIAFQSFLEGNDATNDPWDRDHCWLYLAEMYVQGKGVEKNRAEAYKFAERIVYGGLGQLHKRAHEILAEVQKEDAVATQPH
jgi:hypothetical protein